MAKFGSHCSVISVDVSAAGTLSILQVVAPANHRIQPTWIGGSFNGVTANDPPLMVQVLRQTTAGTSGANTPVKLDDSLAETLQITARDTFVAEPAAGDILQQMYRTVPCFSESS